MGNDGAAFSLVLPDQAAMLDEIEKCISRELQSDRVEGIPAPIRPASRSQRPASGRKPFGGRGPRPPFRAPGKPRGYAAPRGRSDRQPLAAHHD
jgi:hypothetical protein